MIRREKLIRAPVLQLAKMFQDGPNMHFECLKHIAHGLLPNEFLRLSTRQRDITLRKEGCNIPTSNLAFRILFAL